ncbi:DUF4760 domain-containing protein [Mucilaginibacter sp. McL0603]|uniref:DUF4760 domain-containing protein n=1 Tax=Mucilaginibacter sp. McL0603 TaxID=3415670 RepID=UPI003CEC6D6F
MSNQFVALIANIALTLSVIVAVIFGIAQVKTSNKDRRERLTLDTLRSFQTREFAEMLSYINTIKIPYTVEEWLDWPKEDQIRIIHLSQQMESLGLMLAERLINIDLVDKTLGSFVSTTWVLYKPLILDMREKNADPYLSEYFQWMAEQLDRRMKEKPRKPFFLSTKTAV